MKNQFYLSILTLFFFTTLFTTVQAQDGNRIRIIFGTRSHPNSSGDGCEGEKGICLIITRGGASASDRLGSGEISEEYGRLFLNITEDPSPAMEHENSFLVAEDKTLPKELARELGYERVTIRKGTYRLDKSKNPLGSVYLNATFD